MKVPFSVMSGQLAEIDLLLLDVLRPRGAGRSCPCLVHHEAERHLEGDGIGHAPVVALLDRVLGIAEVIAWNSSVAFRCSPDRKHALEHRLQTHVLAGSGEIVLLEKRSYDFRWISIRFGISTIDAIFPKSRRTRRPH